MHDPFMAGSEESFEINEDAAVSLDDGEYIGELIDVEKSESKAGNAMFVWTFQVVATADGNKLATAPELRTFTAVTDRAMWKLEEVLAALGLGKVEGGKLRAKFSRREAIGRMAILEIESQEFGGKVRPTINKVLPHPKGAGYIVSNDIPF